MNNIIISLNTLILATGVSKELKDRKFTVLNENIINNLYNIT